MNFRHMLTEGAIEPSKGQTQPIVVPSYDVCKPQQWPASYNNPKGAAVAWIPCNQQEVINNSLFWLKDYSILGKSNLVLEV